MVGYHRALIGYGELALLGQGAGVRSPFRVAPFTPADMETFRGTGANDLHAAPERVALGDRPWGLWEGDMLVAYGWTTGRPTAFRTLFEVRPAPGEVYFYDFFTHPGHRGRGCYPLLLVGIADALAADGVQAGWIAVTESNTSSWRGVHKAGFQHAGDIITLKNRLGMLLRRGPAPMPPVRLRSRGLLVPTSFLAA